MFDFEQRLDRRGIGAAKWRKIDAAGIQDPDICPFSTADMEFKTAPAVARAVADLATAAVFGYAMVTDEYRQAVCSWLERRHGWQTNPDWQVQTYGVVGAILIAILALTEPGDGVIIQTPVYTPFQIAVKANGRTVVDNPLVLRNGRYEMDFEDLEAKASQPTTRMLLLCSPHNPVGRVWSRAELLKVADICRRNQVIVFSDEIHFDFVFKPHKHTVFATLPQDVLPDCLIGTAASKTFNLASLSTSNIIIPDEGLRQRFVEQTLRSIGHFNSGFGLVATRAAYEGGEAWLDELLEILDQNRRYCLDYFARNLPQIKAIDPEGTYLLWLDMSALGMDDAALLAFLENDARLFVESGPSYGLGGKGFVRLNFACPRDCLEKALDRLAKAVSSRRTAES